MICEIIGGYMLAKTLVVFYVWSPDIFVLSFYQNLFSGIAYSIMSNKTLPYHYDYIKTLTSLFVDMCGVKESVGLCDLYTSRVCAQLLPQDIIRCVLLVNSPTKLKLLSWLLIYFINKESALHQTLKLNCGTECFFTIVN